MIKYLILLSLTLLAALPIFSQTGAALAQIPDLAQQPAARISQEMIDLLPPGAVIPETLPTTIPDPLLLTAWVYLYNQQEPLQAWDGKTLTGRMLAQHVVDHRVAIQWNTINDCNGDSCTERPKSEAVENTNPILVTTWYQNHAQDHLPKLAGTLAHEIFHHMLPFGNVDDTQFEEFWAFSIGAWVAKNERLDAMGHNPMQASCLTLWFSTYQPERYAGLQVYPALMEKAADTSTASCKIIRRLPGEVEGFPGGAGE